MYGGGPYIPFHVATVEFFQQVAKVLSDDGIMAINLPFFAQNTELEQRYLSTIGHVFETAYRVSQVLYAFKQPISKTELLEQLQKQSLLPALEPLRTTLHEQLQAVKLNPTGAVFSDDYAPLERLTFDAITADWLAAERRQRKVLLGY